MPDISNLHINNGKQPFLLANSFLCTIRCFIFIFNISTVDFFKEFINYMLSYFSKPGGKHFTRITGLHAYTLTFSTLARYETCQVQLSYYDCWFFSYFKDLFMIVVSFQRCYLIFDSKLGYQLQYLRQLLIIFRTYESSIVDQSVDEKKFVMISRLIRTRRVVKE